MRKKKDKAKKKKKDEVRKVRAFASVSMIQHLRYACFFSDGFPFCLPLFPRAFSFFSSSFSAATAVYYASAAAIRYSYFLFKNQALRDLGAEEHNDVLVLALHGLDKVAVVRVRRGDARALGPHRRGLARHKHLHQLVNHKAHNQRQDHNVLKKKREKKRKKKRKEKKKKKKRRMKRKREQSGQHKSRDGCVGNHEHTVSPPPRSLSVFFRWANFSPPPLLLFLSSFFLKSVSGRLSTCSSCSFFPTDQRKYYRGVQESLGGWRGGRVRACACCLGLVRTLSHARSRRPPAATSRRKVECTAAARAQHAKPCGYTTYAMLDHHTDRKRGPAAPLVRAPAAAPRPRATVARKRLLSSSMILVAVSRGGRPAALRGRHTAACGLPATAAVPPRGPPPARARPPATCHEVFCEVRGCGCRLGFRHAVLFMSSRNGVLDP